MMMSLGAYPGDAHFDPNRPAWLPYWFDTPTESAMKWGMYPGADTKRQYPDPPRPQAPPVPSGGYTGAVYDPAAVNAVVMASAGAYRQDVANTFSDVADDLDAEASASADAANRRLVFLALAGVVFLIVRR